MENIHNYTLIDGIFEPLEAQRLILDLINTKINYHNREAFSENIRFNNSSNLSKERVLNLKTTADAIKQLVIMANSDDYLLKINGDISIEIIKK